MLLDLLVPLAILPDNVLVTLDTQEPHVINVSISFAFHSGMFPKVLFRCENIGRQDDFANF